MNSIAFLRAVAAATGRRFKSCHPDHIPGNSTRCSMFCVGSPLKIAQRFNAGFQRKEKSKVPLGTTEPSLSYGAPAVPEGTESHLDTISPALKRWAIFGIHGR